MEDFVVAFCKGVGWLGRLVDGYRRPGVQAWMGWDGMGWVGRFGGILLSCVVCSASGVVRDGSRL